MQNDEMPVLVGSRSRGGPKTPIIGTKKRQNGHMLLVLLEAMLQSIASFTVDLKGTAGEW